jgi:hypothetical protein
MLPDMILALLMTCCSNSPVGDACWCPAALHMVLLYGLVVTES